MRVFLAGASGVIGRALVPMLLADGHAVTGTTRSATRARRLADLGIVSAVVDVFDAEALERAMRAAQPEVVIHQLTDLAGGFGPEQLRANARLREIGTANLVAAAAAAGARRLVAQSGAWVYAPGKGDRTEDDPLRSADDPGDLTVPGILALERLVLGGPFEGIVLRYGFLYGPGAQSASPAQLPSVHVEAAARAAAASMTRGRPGVYNVVDDGGGVSNTKARAELCWRPEGRG